MKTIIIVDGEPIQMNPFVSKIVSNTIIAVVNSLDLPKSDWTTLEVSIPKSKTQNLKLFELLWQRLISRFPFLSEILTLV